MCSRRVSSSCFLQDTLHATHITDKHWTPLYASKHKKILRQQQQLVFGIYIYISNYLVVEYTNESMHDHIVATISNQDLNFQQGMSSCPVFEIRDGRLLC